MAKVGQLTIENDWLKKLGGACGHITTVMLAIITKWHRENSVLNAVSKQYDTKIRNLHI